MRPSALAAAGPSWLAALAVASDEAAASGGEGEGGVATADAAKDPVAYGIALAVALPAMQGKKQAAPVVAQPASGFDASTARPISVISGV